MSRLRKYQPLILDDLVCTRGTLVARRPNWLSDHSFHLDDPCGVQSNGFENYGRTLPQHNLFRRSAVRECRVAVLHTEALSGTVGCSQRSYSTVSGLSSQTPFVIVIAIIPSPSRDRGTCLDIFCVTRYLPVCAVTRLWRTMQR